MLLSGIILTPLLLEGDIQSLIANNKIHKLPATRIAGSGVACCNAGRTEWNE